MRIILLLFIIFVSNYVLAQKEGKTIYNTRIGQAKKVEIKDGVIEIKNADTVIISVYKDLKSQIYLEGVRQILDTSGIYLTYVTVRNPYSKMLELDIEFNFDKPFIRVEHLFGTGGVYRGLDKTYLWFTLAGSLYEPKQGGDIVILSETPIKLKIKGLLDMIKN